MKRIFLILIFMVSFTISAKEGDAFSISTDVEGNTVVYGRVYYNYIDSTSQGRIFIYEKSGDELVLEKEIPEGQEDNGDLFGGMIDISGDTIFSSNSVFGISTLNDKKVDVYMKTDDGWNLFKTILPPEEYSTGEFSGAIFASMISADGTNLLVSANKGTDDASDILVYSKSDDYSTYKTISPVIEESYSRFFFPKGFDISENRIAATSASFINDFTYGPNFIYIFDLNEESGEWEESNRIEVDYQNPVDSFGYSISIEGDILIVSAFDYEGTGKGRAIIYEKIENEWQKIKVLAPDSSEDENYFGWNVSISGDFAVVTDRKEDKMLPYGTTYVFHRNYNPEDPESGIENNWGLYQKFEVTDESETPMKGALAVLKKETLSLGADPEVNNYVNSKITPYVEKLIPPVFTELPDEDVSEEADESIVDDMETPEADDNEINDDDVQAVEKDKSSGSSCSAVII